MTIGPTTAPDPLPAQGDGSRRSGHPACNAPFTSLYLDPAGEVRACCQNEWQRLGRIGEQTLREIWDGPGLDGLRVAVAEGSLRLGCELCAQAVANGSPSSAFLKVYEGLTPTGPHPRWPRRLELAISNTCNLQCTMCNGDLSSAIRSARERRRPLVNVYDEAFFAELDDFLPHLEELVLLGGEPLLARPSLRVLERTLELALHPSIHITTNGTQWNERIERLFSSLPVHAAVSIDGYSEETFAAIRLGADLAGVRRNLDRYREATSRSGGSVSIAFSLQTANWHEFGQTLAWADSQGLRVFVNAVDYPSWLSLLRLDATDLEQVARQLEQEGEGLRPSLRLNGDVWDDELRRLRSEVERRQGLDRARPVQITRSAARRHALAIAAEGATTPPAEFLVGTGAVVQDILPDAADVCGTDLRASIGTTLIGAIRPLTVGRGPLVSSTLELHDDGVEQRVLVHGDDERRHQLTMTAVPGPGASETWFVGERVIDGSPGGSSALAQSP